MFFRFAPMGKVEKTRFVKNYTTFVNRLYALLGKAHPKWWYETEILKFDSQGVFSFRPDGESGKNDFEQKYTTFVNPALCAAWKSPPKMVVWNRNFKSQFPGCFFVSPRWGKSRKRVLNKIIRPSSTRLYALLVKAHPKWWYETKVAKLDSQGVFSFCPDGESRKNAFWKKL